MRKNKQYAFAVYSILFIVNVFLMFFLTRSGNGFRGHLVPWIVAVGMTPLGVFMLWPTRKKIKVDVNKFIFFGMILALNLLMGLFSILDIVGEAHYSMSSIMFTVAPAMTILQYGIRHVARK